MEHRNGTRFAVNMAVELWRGDKNYGRHNVNDIGNGGLFLKYPGEDIRPGDLLMAKWMASGSGGVSECSAKAMVVHRSEQGIGLMWADYNEPFDVAITEMLQVA